MTTESRPILWVDADACPKSVKEIIYRASFRLQLQVLIVANSYMQVPPGTLVRSIQVDAGADEADNYIVQEVRPQDIVITADIPLAARVVEKGSVAIDHRGDRYTEDNVRERLSMRDFMKDVRDSGVITGGPAPFGPKDVERFANSLNMLLSKIKP